MEHDAWFFIGVFVFIFIIWVATGGPLHPLAYTGPTLSQPTPIGGGTYLRLPQANMGIGGSGGVLLPGSTGSSQPLQGSSLSGGTQATRQVTGGVSFGLASPYQGLVTMNHSVVNASSSDPKKEYVQISLAQNASNAIDITGWVLQSDASTKAELIPKGTIVPTSGVVNAKQDIILQPGERAIIVSGESPVGASFRENKCTAYFASMQKFTPSLSLNCPSASTELKTYYGTPYIHDPNCIDYVNTLPRCEVAVNTPSNLSLTCEDFLESRFNYNGCLANHQQDSDFNGKVWRIYLGRTKDDGPLWRTKHEVVRLLDDRGKTVDVFTY